MKRLNDRLKNWISKNNFTNVQAAAKIGCSARSLSRWLNNDPISYAFMLVIKSKRLF